MKKRNILTLATLLLLASCSITTTTSSSNNVVESSINDNSINVSTSEGNQTSDNQVISDSNNTESSSISSSQEDYTFSKDDGILTYGTYIEACYATFKGTDPSKVKVEYKDSRQNIEYTTIDKELIRKIDSNTLRFDAVGLKEGIYSFRIQTEDNNTLTMNNISITRADRSGYAFYNTTEGVGAYNIDGTLKKNAIVVYVNEENKNTVKANGKTGLAAIIKSATSGTPLCVRFLGRIICDTRNSSGKYEGIYTMINGLTDKPTSDGTYFNMLDVDGGKNITIEGIGEDAEIYQWGMEFIRCSSLEVKNLIFSKYTDDACGIDGDRANPSKYKRFFIHNNRFNIGENKYNDTPEHDKAEGDGSTDIKGVSYATYAYNSYYNCHKTGLVGGSDSDLTSHLTYHHNYYSNCQSRLPLGRQANMHYYNNVFEGTTNTCMDLRSNAYVFSEANYFVNSKNPVKTKSAACKSYNDVFKSTSGTNNATIVKSREEKVSNSCKYGSSFDTDASNFYYDSSKKVSNVEHLTTAEVAYTETKQYAGVQKINPLTSNINSNNPSVTTSSSSSTTQNNSSSKPVTPSNLKALFNAADLQTKTYTSSFSTSIFDIKCQSDKNVEILDSSEYTSFNSSYTKVLKLGGKGNSDYRSIHFTVSASSKVRVYAKSTGTDTRVLQVNSSSSSLVNEYNVTATPSMIEFDLSKGTYYLNSSNKNIEIAAIEIY